MEPLDAAGNETGPPIAAIDVVAAGVGDTVFWVGSLEAAQALEPPFPAVDASVVGLVDRIDLLETVAKKNRSGER